MLSKSVNCGLIRKVVISTERWQNVCRLWLLLCVVMPVLDIVDPDVNLFNDLIHVIPKWMQTEKQDIVNIVTVKPLNSAPSWRRAIPWIRANYICKSVVFNYQWNPSEWPPFYTRFPLFSKYQIPGFLKVYGSKFKVFCANFQVLSYKF